MLFSSLEFLFLFLPVSIGVYFLLPKSFKNLWLFISGIVFYAFGEPKFLPVMLLTAAVDFLLGLVIARSCERPRAARALLWCAVAYNAGQLAYFKFISEELPIGISFYTFQALSYVVDVYRKRAAPCRDPIAFGAYISLYPQLIAGPIVKYSDVSRSLRSREHSAERVATGLRTFIVGLSKKVLLANAAGQMWQSFCTYSGFADAYVGIFFFSMQIYFDFSGYSDMAQGLGRIFGFDFPKNFDYPYLCQSITDFWRRWHITLSSFFREYVYIELGGNRGGMAKMLRNLLLTWALTGLWHGATLNFLVWGLYFACVLIVEKLFLLKVLSRVPRAFRHIYALTLVAIGWLIFATDGVSLGLLEGWQYLLRMLGIGCSSFISDIALYETSRNLIFIILLVLGATPLPKRLFERVRRHASARAFCELLAPLALFALCVSYIVNSGYNPFLYFRF